MSKVRFETGKAPQIIVSAVHRDLVVKGWSEPIVTLEGDENQIQAEESEKGLTITATRDLVVMVPQNAVVSILQVNRDAAIKNVAGDLIIGQVNRDLVVRQAGNVEIGDVNHDLVVRSASGLVQIAQVNGDLSLRDVQDVTLGTANGDVSGRDIKGQFQVKEIMGDFSLRDLSGDANLGVVHRDVSLKGIDGRVTLAQGMGDVRLQGPVGDGKHQLHCQRDLVLRWPTNLPLTLTATAPQIRNRLSLEDVVEEADMLSGRIGEGGPVLNLSAEGRIILKPAEMVDEKMFKFAFDDGEFDFDVDVNVEGIGEKISHEVNKRMADVRNRMAQMSVEMEERMGTEFTGRFEAQAQRMAEKAERMAEKALQQAEKALKQTRQKAAAASTPASSPTPTKTAVSPEEKLKILKMLEKGVITVEEANSLLAAIEG